MEKRSIDKRERFLGKDELEAEPGEVSKQSASTRKLVLMKNVKLIYKGAVTGNIYLFDGAGSIVDVDVLDADEMLARRSKSRCCPGSGVGHSTPYFEEVR